MISLHLLPANIKQLRETPMKIAFIVPINHQNSHMNPIPYGRNTATQLCSHGTWHPRWIRWLRPASERCQQERCRHWSDNWRRSISGQRRLVLVGGNPCGFIWDTTREMMHQQGMHQQEKLSIKFSELAINKGNDASNMIYEHASCVNWDS